MSLTSKFFNEHLKCGALDLPDPSLSFKSAIALNSTSRVAHDGWPGWPLISVLWSALSLLLTMLSTAHCSPETPHWHSGLPMQPGDLAGEAGPLPHHLAHLIFTQPGSSGWRPMCPLWNNVAPVIKNNSSVTALFCDLWCVTMTLFPHSWGWQCLHPGDNQGAGGSYGLLPTYTVMNV